jgi:phthalate 4,5-cis-dihydrodiol dehydrogenase
VPPRKYDRVREQRKRAQDPEAEHKLKNTASYPVRSGAFEGNDYQPFFGLTLVSCERGDIRQSPTGLLVYDGTRPTEIDLSRSGTPRDAVLQEFHNAITTTGRTIHVGRWGLATLEVCLAAVESARTHREVRLSEQVPIYRPPAT